MQKGQNKFLKVGKFFQKLFHVKAFFTKVAPLGEIKARYAVFDNEVCVDLSCETQKSDYKLFVMNELGGDMFSQSIINGKPSLPPSAWQKIDGQCELYSPIHSLAFTIVERMFLIMSRALSSGEGNTPVIFAGRVLKVRSNAIYAKLTITVIR